MRQPRSVGRTLLFLSLLVPSLALAQSFNGSISGTVKDPQGGSIASAEMVLKNQATGIELKRTSQEGGEFAFRNLVPGSYELRVTGAGFQPYVQKNIEVAPNAQRPPRPEPHPRLPRREEVDVVAETSTLNYDNAAHEDGIAPDTLAQLPLQFNSGPRSAATFAILMPGVSTGRHGQRLRRPHQRRHAVWRRGCGGRREHAAGLHEPERHGLDLPGLPVLAGHGERDQGRDHELRAALRLQHFGADRGHHQVRHRPLPRRRSSSTTRTTA